MFTLHPNLARKAFIVDLPLCQVLMEDEKNYPWLLLVPRRAGVSKMIDLSLEDQLQLVKELNAIQKILWHAFNPTQLNVAAIGNKTPQLHMHVIVRHANDPAWPNTIWDHPIRAKYNEKEKIEMIETFKSKLCGIEFD